jgi:hypothetical protein
MSISIEAHDRICQDLHQQIRSLIVENEKLRAALEQPRQFTFAPKPPSPPPAPQGYDGTEAGLHPFSWRDNV